MTALDVPLRPETYTKLMEDYLISRQFQPAFDILRRMQPTTVAFTRFLHGCCESKQLVQADNAWMLMKAKGIFPTAVAYNLMIRCHGKCGDIQGAMHILQEMKELGLELTEDTLNSVLDAHLQVCELDACVRVFKEIADAGFAPNLHRLRKLIHALCIDRRVEDAFDVFELAASCDVDGDLKVCSDLIDLAKECSSPERVPTVFQCMVRKAVRLDIGRAHVLIAQLSQVDRLSDAMTVLNWLPFSAQRANSETYLQLLGTCFRSGLGEDGMRIIKEFSQVAPADKRPSLHFYNFCLRGYRALKLPNSCQAVMELIWKEESIDPDYDSYAELTCANLEARRFKPALIVLSLMAKAGFQPLAGVTNVYIVCLAASKTLQHHDLAWGMYTGQVAAGVRIEGGTHSTMFDSCVAHARITRTLEAGANMEAAHLPMGPKRLDHLRRARAIVHAVGANPGPGQPNYNLKRPQTTGSHLERGARSSVISAAGSKLSSRPGSPAVSSTATSPGLSPPPRLSTGTSAAAQRLPRLHKLSSDPASGPMSSMDLAASPSPSPSRSAGNNFKGSRHPSRSGTALSQASTRRGASPSGPSSRASSRSGALTPALTPPRSHSRSPLPPLPALDTAENDHGGKSRLASGLSSSDSVGPAPGSVAPLTAAAEARQLQADSGGESQFVRRTSGSTAWSEAASDMEGNHTAGGDDGQRATGHDRAQTGPPARGDQGAAQHLSRQQRTESEGSHQPSEGVSSCSLEMDAVGRGGESQVRRAGSQMRVQFAESGKAGDSEEEEA